MINKLMLIAMFILLVACTNTEKVGIAISGNKVFDRVCVDGVEYLYAIQGYGHVMTPHLKTNGKLYLCERKG